MFFTPSDSENIAAKERIESARFERFTSAKALLQNLENEPRFDFCDCGMSDAMLKEVVDIFLAKIQLNSDTKIELLDISGKNSLTEAATPDILRLIAALPNTNFISGSISVADQQSVDAVKQALHEREQQGGITCSMIDVSINPDVERARSPRI